MTRTPPLTLFDVPTEITDIETPRWESWERAFQELRRCPGQLWIVSPFITAVPTGMDFQGARVLTTLDAHKIATNSTSLGTLEELQRRGAQVQILDALHAKVYFKRTDSGATGYAGSANLTKRADRYNKEVMSGPHALNDDFLRQLDEHWGRAQRLTPALIDQVKLEAAHYLENARAQGRVEEDIVVFSVSVAMFNGAFTLTEDRIGVPQQECTKGLRPAQVNYVTPAARKQGTELVLRQLKEARNGRHGVARPLPGHGRLYAVPLKDVEHFRDTVTRLDQDLRQAMLALRDQQRGRWKDAFLIRLETAIRAYNKASPTIIPQVLKVAAQEFDNCMQRAQVSVQYSEFLPLKGSGSEAHHRVYRAVRENQPLNMNDEVEDAL